MSAPWHDPDWEPDLYGAPSAASARFGAPTTGLGPKKMLSVTHDLTDDELKRFVNFDVWYDPKPLLGVIPQWVLIALIAGAVGASMGLSVVAPGRVVMLGGLALPILALGSLEITAAARRRHARALGLCEGRTVTITPQGFWVQIPDARATSMLGIGPGLRRWEDVRAITASRDDLTFWMRPTLPDLEGRLRVIIPLRAFPNRTEAAGFETAARCWHAAATGGDSRWWDEVGP